MYQIRAFLTMVALLAPGSGSPSALDFSFSFASPMAREPPRLPADDRDFASASALFGKRYLLASAINYCIRRIRCASVQTARDARALAALELP